MNIELIYAWDCPNVDAAREQLRTALGRVGLPLRWTEWNRAHPDAPNHARKYGSPTILVDGKDVAGVEDSEGADCCRVYVDESGFRGVPSLEMLVRALNEGRHPSRLAGLSAFLGSGVASLCCGVPLLSAFLGIAGSGVAGYFSRFQHLLTGIGFLAILSGWALLWNEWRKARNAGARLRNARWTAALLAAGTALVIGFSGLSLYSRIRVDTPIQATRTQDRVLTVRVSGMTCATCEIHVQRTVGKLNGVRTVQASTARGNVRVVFDPASISKKAILDAVRHTGYPIIDPG